MTLPKLLVTSCRVIPKSSSGMLYHVYPMAARTLPTRLVATRGLHHLTSSTSTPMTFFRQHAAPTSPFSTTSSVAAAHEDSQGGKTPIDMYHPQPMRPEFLTPVTPQQLEKLDIGLTKHTEPKDLRDKFALSVVRSMRIPADMFFRKKYMHRAVMLETVAGVPGMVGGMLRHLRSLRKLKHDGGWIAHLLHEAENERMHLMTFMKLSQPNILERLLVTAVQGVFFNVFFLLYIVSPKTAHRVVGYLEEEAVISYTQFLGEIDAGRIANVPAPEIALEYWNLPKDARLREVVLAVRADEAVHRDSNHHFADCIAVGKDDLRTVHKVDQSVWVAAPKGLKKIAQGPPPHGPVQPSA